MKNHASAIHPGTKEAGTRCAFGQNAGENAGVPGFGKGKAAGKRPGYFHYFPGNSMAYGLGFCEFYPYAAAENAPLQAKYRKPAGLEFSYKYIVDKCPREEYNPVLLLMEYE